MEGRFLLDVIVRESATVLELFSSEDETLLIRRDSFLVLNLGLDVVDRVGRFDFEGDLKRRGKESEFSSKLRESLSGTHSLSSQSLDEDLHTSSETENQMKSGFLLDVVVGEGATVLELFSSEDQSLLIRWDSFLVLNLGLDVVDRVGRFNFEGDLERRAIDEFSSKLRESLSRTHSLSSQSLDEDLHTSSKTENQMKSGFLLDVVVGEGATVFKLFSSEDQSLLIRRDTFLVLNLGLDVVDGVGRLDFEGDLREERGNKHESVFISKGDSATVSTYGLSSESLYEDLHGLGVILAVK